MRLTPILIALGAVVLVAGGVRSARAANRASVTDATGDYVGGSPDVTGASIENDDTGLVTVTVQLASTRPLAAGMRVGVAFDTDANTSTGLAAERGAEFLLQFDVTPNTITYSRWNGSAMETRFTTTGSVTNTATSATFKINRSELAGTSRMNVHVYADRWNGSAFEADVAPDAGGSWLYDVLVSSTGTPPTTGNDPDGDGVAGSEDACPTVAAGAYDTNDNGCPGPFSTIHVPTGAELRPSSTSGGFARYATPRNTIHRLPPGTQVLLQYGNGRERLQAGTSGTVTSALLLRSRFRSGAAVEVRAWKPGWIGFAIRLVVRTKGPSAVVTNRRCIGATDSSPHPCSQVSHGR
jgi:hypothetical protein